MKVQRIERLDDPRVADYRNVRDAALRERRGVFIAESRLGVRRLLAAQSRFRTRSLLVTETALRGLQADLAGLAAGTPVYLAAPALLNQIVGFRMHRGCLAVGERGAGIRFAEVLEACARGPRLLVVLEDVANPENVGSLFRNALAFGADALLLTGGCADPLYRKAIRVSMGATLRLPFARLPAWREARPALRAAGFQLVALAPDRSATDLRAFGSAMPLPQRLALAVGSEGDGLSAGILADADAVARVAMAEGVDSLNVATAAAIALHHFGRTGARAPASRGTRISR